MKEFKEDKILLAYWTSLSNALKTVASATYGYSGSRFSPLFKKSVALSITAFCHSTLKEIIEYLKSLGYEIIYGDTNSIFYIIPIVYLKKLTYKREKIKRTIEIFLELEKQVNKNIMVLDFVQKRINSGKSIAPERFFYYVLDLDYKNIGYKICLVNEFNSNKDKIDLLYYLKSSKDLCESFFSCKKGEAEKIIISLYKEITEKSEQIRIDNNLNINFI
ncbi:9516_t:CDS:2 [Racocetra fulgida]|uniref:DNA-directed DNA polymerase n=1 Tax=Racocetra fulgida TaxID=60492 RepID=A0A9N8WDN5_9GLOM|nr:9516_t:CDS:2 [Racocetra fulgida]